MRVNSYIKVDAIEQKDMVNSGARGKKDRNLRTEVIPLILIPYNRSRSTGIVQYLQYNLTYHF